MTDSGNNFCKKYVEPMLKIERESFAEINQEEIVTSAYNIVDGYFISNFAGKNAFAAVNLIMPVLMALGAFGFMIGTGGSALVAFTLGVGDNARANQIFSMLIKLVVIVGISPVKVI